MKISEIQKFVSEGGIAVVVTPKFTRNGSGADGIPVDTRLLVRCMEKPPVAAGNSNALRALDAAEIVALGRAGRLRGRRQLHNRGIKNH